MASDLKLQIKSNSTPAPIHRWIGRLRPHALLLLILLFAFALRCWDLGDNPPGFFRDEADKAVTARSLMTTGRDLEGSVLPFFVRSLNVYTSGIYQYILIPFILILGSAEWVIRLPAALAGTATVGVVYLIGKEAYHRKIGLLAAALLAISPWHLQFSRWANQGIFLPLCLALAVYFFLKGRGPVVEGELNVPVGGYRFKPFFFSAIFLSLALYTYAPAKLLLPLFFIMLVVIYWRDFFAVIPSQRWPYFYKYVALVVLLGLPMTWYTFFESTQSGARFESISLYHQANNFSEFLRLFILNYFSHFSWQFLAGSGDANLRHSIPFIGQLLKPEVFLLIAGIYALIRRHKREDIMLLGWLLIGPLPAALTNEGVPHALRSIGILPSIQIISAVGAFRVYEFFVFREQRGEIRSRLPRLTYLVAISGSYLVFGAIFLVSLFFLYPKNAGPWWEYGYREIIEYAESNRPDSGEIVFSGWAPYADIHVLYVTQPSLRDYQKNREIEHYRFLSYGRSYLNERFDQSIPRTFILSHLDQIPPNPQYWVQYPNKDLAWAIISQP